MTSTANSPWRPLRERMAGMTGERTLVEGVPDYMLQPLSGWLLRAAQKEGLLDLAALVQLRVRSTGGFGRASNGYRYVLFQGDALLEAIDAAMDIYSYLAETDANGVFENQWWGSMLTELRLLLEHGGSVWKPNDDFTGPDLSRS